MKRILVADDEYFEREAVKMMLNGVSSEYQVVAEATTGLEAIEMVEREHIDIVFLDIQMPQLSGIEAAKRMKELKPDLIIIMLTAYSEFDLVHRALKLHVEDYLLKPCRPEHLIEALESAIKSAKESPQPKKLSENDLKKELRYHFFRGDYIQTKASMDALLHRHHFSVEEEIEDMKEILVLINQVAEHYHIDIQKNSQRHAYEKLRSVSKKDEYYALIDYLIEEIFEMIISDKLADWAREMDYALQYIEKNVTKRITLEDVASYMNISPHYFSKLFKMEVGINFIDYMTERKIMRAKTLMRETDEPINNIAFELGFNEANYFSKVFKKISGISPSEYRRQVLSEREAQGDLMRKMTIKSSPKWIV